jgi:hypothetical protein
MSNKFDFSKIDSAEEQLRRKPLMDKVNADNIREMEHLKESIHLERLMGRTKKDCLKDWMIMLRILYQQEPGEWVPDDQGRERPRKGAK